MSAYQKARARNDLGNFLQFGQNISFPFDFLRTQLGVPLLSASKYDIDLWGGRGAAKFF